MKEKEDALTTLKLSLELLKRIPKGRTITAPELRRQLIDANSEFKRSPRTIQRLLETLSTYYDIDRDDRSKPYRYCWKENAKGLSLPGLSTQESLLLTLAEQQLSSLLPAKLMKSMQGFFTQARASPFLIVLTSLASYFCRSFFVTVAAICFVISANKTVTSAPFDRRPKWRSSR